MGETLIGLIHPVWWAYCLTNSQEIKSTDLFSAYKESWHYPLLLTLFNFPRNKNNHAAYKPRGYHILYGGDKEDRTPDLLHAISKFPENKLN